MAKPLAKDNVESMRGVMHLHRDAVPVDGVGALAASTARCLVGHCGETKAVLQILGDASSQAQRAADALAKTELMLSCESGDVEQCKRALGGRPLRTEEGGPQQIAALAFQRETRGSQLRMRRQKMRRRTRGDGRRGTAQKKNMLPLPLGRRCCTS